MDFNLLFGISLILFIGILIGWYLCLRWYEKKIFAMIHACHEINGKTISLLEDALAAKKEIQDIYQKEKDKG